MKVDTLYSQGQYDLAQEKADLAKKWGIGGLIAGIVFWFLYIIFVFGITFLSAIAA